MSRAKHWNAGEGSRQADHTTRRQEEATMAGPGKVEFPGQSKRQRMRARGTKRASEGVKRKLEKNLSALLDDPALILPSMDYIARRWRNDPVQRSIAECAKVILKKNDRRWLGKKMVRRRGDGIARALAGSLHAAHDDERSMVAVFSHPIFGTASFVRRGVSRQTALVSMQNHAHPTLRLLAWEEHAKAGWWFFSVGSSIVCTGPSPSPPENWLAESVVDAPMKITAVDGVYCSPSATADLSTALRLQIGDDVVILAEEDLSSVDEEDSFTRSVALRMLPPKLSTFTDAEWGWRPEGWPEDRDLPPAAQEKVDEVLEAWLNLSLADSILPKLLRRALCNHLDEGCIIGERWWAMDDRESMFESMAGSAPEKAALALIIDEALQEGGLHVRGDGTFEELEEDVLRLEEVGCHANLVALWPEWADLVLDELYGITGDAASEIIERQARRKQGFGAFLKKMESQREEHLLLSRFPWREGELAGLCGHADALIRKARADGVGVTISMVKKGKSASEKALGWAWICVHERSESEGWHFDSDARDKGGDWVPALSELYAASEGLANDSEGGREGYVGAMRTFAERSGATLDLPDA